MRKRTENPRLSGPSLSLFLLLLLLRKRGCFRWCEKENRLFKALLFSDVSLPVRCVVGDVPFSQTPQIKKYRVGWLEKSHALSLERERDDRKRARMRRSVIRCVAEVRFCAEVKVCCSQRWSCASSRVHRMLVPHVIENISNLKLLTTPNEDAISQTLLLNRASNALQTHISATLIAPLDSQAAREYNESLNNNIRFLFCGGGGDIFYSRDM